MKLRAEPVSSERSWACFYLARALGKLADKSSNELLLSILTDDPAEAALGLLAPPNIFLFEAMTPMFRAAAADAVGRIGSSSSLQTLLEAAANPQNALDVRNASAGALSRLATAENADRIKTVAAACPEISTRKLLFQACEVAMQTQPGKTQ